MNSIDSEGKFIVNSVPKAYPAEIAGIVIGDELADGCPDCKGAVGGITRVLIKKPDGTLKEYHLVREKICTEDI